MTSLVRLHGRRHYDREVLARTLACVYLGIVVLSALPFAIEMITGTHSGGFGFIWLILTTAPLSFATILLINVVPGVADMSETVLLGAAVVVPALINAWVVWRILRGRAVP